MTMRLPTTPDRRRADQFARILDGGPATNDPALAPLAQLAGALRALPLGPTPDFRSALRQRLVAVATVQGVGAVAAGAPLAVVRPLPSTDQVGALGRFTEWAEGWRVRGRFTAATASLAAVVLLGGIGLAGSRSLPGDPFYRVKRGVESLQLATAGSTEAKGERHLQFARTRLSEVQALVGSSETLGAGRNGGDGPGAVAGGLALGGSLSSHVVSTLQDMDDETEAGTRDLTRAYTDSQDKAPLLTLRSFSQDQGSQLAAVLPALPAEAAVQASRSLSLIERVSGRVEDLLATDACTSACEDIQSGAPAPTGKDGSGPPAPCSCVTTPTPQNSPADGNSSDGKGNQNGSDDGGGKSPKPGKTPEPGQSGGPQPGDPAPKPSPTPTTLEDQLGDIISHLPLPVTPPPLPHLPEAPVPVPTIHLPLGGH